MKPKKIAFFGLFGQQNLGNESTLQAILYHARRCMPDVEVKCICTGPEDVSQRYHISAFPISYQHAKGFKSKVRLSQTNRLMKLLRQVLIRIPKELRHCFKALRALQGSHMLIVAGAGLLSDYATRPLGIPYEIFRWAVISKLCRCKLLFVSVGAGPICHPLTKWFIISALALADYRSYRDSFSKQYVKSIGFERKSDRVYPDLAFSLPRTMIPQCNRGIRTKPVVGVGLLDYNGRIGLRQPGSEAIYLDFISKLDTFVAWLLDHQYTVRILIGDALYDSRVKRDLLALIEKGASKFENGQIIDEPVSSVEELLSQLATTDVVISPRFHNILLALMLCKPVVSLSYHEKFESIMGKMGLAGYCQDIDHLDVDRLIEQFVRLEKKANTFKPHIERRTEACRKALEEQYRIIFNDA